MLRRLALLIATSPVLLAAASAPVTATAEPVDSALEQARAEARAADADLRRLEQAAAKAGSEAARLAAERRAAAVAIAASEARISAADAELALANAQMAQRAARLAQRQAPLASLLAGIVSMGRRPPLLGLADSASLGEFVRVRALLDTALPVIRARSAALSAELADSRRLQGAAAAARQRLADARGQLETRQRRFAALEAEAAGRAAEFSAGAVEASDVAVASSESESRLLSAAARRRAEIRLAASLGDLPPAPLRPGPARPSEPPIAYRLPVLAPLTEGVGSVSDNGIRARGLTFQTYSGAAVTVPADGTIAFAGPFRRHDGVVIIDHGRGWMTLMTGVRASLRKGDRAKAGEPLGRALGPVTVELSTNGRPVSAALIAGSSQLLSNRGKSG
jgi:septal ring factor EnvC (AmiA/AmiB activator)